MQSPDTQPVAAFTAALEATGGRVERARDPQEAAAKVAAAAQRQGVREVLYARCELVERAGLKLLLAAHGIELVPVELSAEKARQIRVGLTGAELAVAETGTLLIGGTPGAWGLASVLPWVHLVLLPEAAIVADLPAAFRRFEARLTAGERDWVWVTGPSRTADIGHTLVLGAHGPNTLQVVVVG